MSVASWRKGPERTNENDKGGDFVSLGQELVDAGFVQPEQIAHALEQQNATGQPLGECLLATGALTSNELDRFFDYMVPPVLTLEDTGLELTFLTDLMLKIMYVYGAETKGAIGDEIKLPQKIVSELVEVARERRLITALGSSDKEVRLVPDIRYGLTDAGREVAVRALQKSEYAGPAPVPIDAYRDQVMRQRIINDRVDRTKLEATLRSLVLSESMVNNLGPGINSGRAMLFYGSPGNGKTSIAVALARAFEQYIYVPYSMEVGGQIISVYDPVIHTPVSAEGLPNPDAAIGRGVRETGDDPRWVRCQRPVAITGGELTLDMLDLGYNEALRYSEAPLQLKAMGGVFLIDDLGRQAVRASDILNRWVFPLEHRIDYLTLPSGKKFSVPFDGVLIFSTNQSPGQLFDDAMLRRIPYKFHISPPTVEEYGRIFVRECKKAKIEFDKDLVQELLQIYYPEHDLKLAKFQPAFMIRHIVAKCRYLGKTPAMNRELLFEAAEHLVVRE